MRGTKVLDLGIADVHIDQAGGLGRKKMAEKTLVPPKGKKKGGKKPIIDPQPKGKLPVGNGGGMRRGFRLSINDPKRGRIEVRHMTDVHIPGVELDATLLSDSDEAAKPVWIQLAKQGQFFKDGPFKLDAEVFTDIIRNFNGTQNHQVPIDFEHATEMPAHAGSIPALGAPAQGWIKQIEMRSDGNLWGLVEWNGLARDYIKAGAYKFISPAIRFGAKNPHNNQNIGAKLTSAALTNKPFLDGMAQVAASDATSTEVSINGEQGGQYSLSSYSTTEYMPMVRACLKMGELSTAKDCSAQLNTLREHFMAAGGDATASPQGVPLSQYMVAMREMVRMPMTASWDDILDAVEGMIEAAIAEHEAAYHEEELTAADDDDDDDDEDDDETLSTTATDGGSEEETNMSENVELTKQLTDTKAEVITLKEKVITLTDTAKAQETNVAGLTLKLKDSESKTTEAQAKIVELEKSNKELTEKLATEETKRLTDKVDTAFAVYKDSKQLTEDHKEMMLLTAKVQPDLFAKLYPAVDPSKAHLLTNVSTKNGKAAKPPVTTGAGDGGTVTGSGNEVPDIRTLTDQYVKDGKTIEDAVSMAYADARKRSNQDTSVIG